jgi:hypothetical protein
VNLLIYIGERNGFGGKKSWRMEFRKDWAKVGRRNNRKKKIKINILDKTLQKRRKGIDRRN